MVAHVSQAKLIVLARKVHFAAATATLLFAVAISVVVLHGRHLINTHIIAAVENGVIVGQLTCPRNGHARWHLVRRSVISSSDLVIEIIVHGTIDWTCETYTIAIEHVVLCFGV